MLLGAARIRRALALGEIVCSDFAGAVEGCHIDVRLGTDYWLPRPGIGEQLPQLIVPDADDPTLWYEHHVATTYLLIPPRTHALAHTIEYIGTTVPYLQPFLQTRSTLARWGVPIHLSAGWGDPGYCSRWTLELYNPWPRSVVLPVGGRVGCIGFIEVAGNESAYEGRYNASALEWTPAAMLPRQGNM